MGTLEGADNQGLKIKRIGRRWDKENGKEVKIKEGGIKNRGQG